MSLVLGSAIACASSHAAAETSADCPSFPPVRAVSAVNIYDNGHSVQNESNANETKHMLAPIDDFITYLAKAVDQKSDAADLKCPYDLLRQWAAADALLGAPEGGSTAQVDSVMISASFGFIILKFRLRGVAITPDVANWYGKLAANVKNANESLAHNHGVFATHRSNTYPWAGSVAGLSALIGGNPVAAKFADEVWENELAEIGPDGTTTAEMAREGRALVYLQLTSNGMLVLHHIRRALGRPDKPAEIDRFKLLLNKVGDSLCNPEQLAKQAGKKQEIPGVWGYRVPYGINDGLLPETWKQCGPKQPTYITVEMGGGDTRVSAEAVDAARHKN